MLRRADMPAEAAIEPNFVVDQAPVGVRGGRRPGPLDSLLDTGPGFAVTLRGYDRLQVDNYVAWAEAELRTSRRETDDLMARYGQACAELELSRRLLARSHEGQELTRMSERMGSMLRLAADEAAEITAAAQEEADRIVAEARADADARLRKVTAIKQVAMSAGDSFREEARRLRQEAAAELDRARQQAAAELQRARAEAEQMVRTVELERREQVAAEARAAGARVAQLQSEIDDLQRQRVAAGQSLRRLTEQLDDALQALAGPPPAPVARVAVGEPVRR